MPSLGNTTIFLLASTLLGDAIHSFVHLFIYFIFLLGFILADLPIQPLVLSPQFFNRGRPLYIALFVKDGSCSSELGYQGHTFECWPSLPVVIFERV